jgi:alpha-glucosidase
MNAMVLAEEAPEHAPRAKLDWWRGAVIYQIYPRSFQDSNADGIGDLAGITQRLDYVADLGVDAIWLSPFFPSPMKDFGYDISDYRGVDPIFGSFDDFERLLERAHALGLKVIIDQVLNHTSDQHPWFQQSRHDKTGYYSDWYVWADPKPDGTPPNNWLSIFGGPAWSWDSRRCQYYLHNFLPAQPDLNFHNPKVRQALLDVCRFWLDRGVDGFRLDTVNFYFQSAGLEPNPPVDEAMYNASTAPAVNPYNMQDHLFDKSRPENFEFLRELRALMNRYPGSTTVGEIGDAQRQTDLMAAYTSGGDKLHMAYTFDFLGGHFEAPYFRRHIASVKRMLADGWPCWAFSNHDVVRHTSRWAVEYRYESQFAKLCAMILLTLRGSVCIYQGEELGLENAELSFEDLVDPYGIQFWPNYKGRDGCRTPMVWQSTASQGAFTSAVRPWLPVPAGHLIRAVDNQDADAGSVLNFYRELIRLRRVHPALVSGDLEPIEAPETVLAYLRTNGDDSVVCAFNMSAEPAKVKIPGDRRVHDLKWVGEQGARKGAQLRLGPYEGYVGQMLKGSARRGPQPSEGN